MYHDYWKLDHSPFENFCDVSFFVASETHQAGLLKLRYLIENRKGIGVLVGGSGTGKTCLIQKLEAELAQTHGPFVQLAFPQMSATETLRYLAVELGGDEQRLTASDQNVDLCVREIGRQLLAFRDAGRHPVIVVDEAHLVEDADTLQALRLLCNFQPQSAAHFSLIFSGHREVLSQLKRISQLEERVAVQCLIRPLSADETQIYIEERLRIAGSNRPIFDPAACRCIFELTAGIPRRINRLCDLALLVGYADDVRNITPEQLEAVAEELTTAAAD